MPSQLNCWKEVRMLMRGVFCSICLRYLDLTICIVTPVSHCYVTRAAHDNDSSRICLWSEGRI